MLDKQQLGCETLVLGHLPQPVDTVQLTASRAVRRAMSLLKRHRAQCPRKYAMGTA
jgi:hypothetical protein